MSKSIMPLDGMNMKLPQGYAHTTTCYGGCTNCCAKINSVVRITPKQLRKTV